jgi:hypothetical protein
MPDTDENMPLGYIVSEELFEVYAKKHGLPESSDIVMAAMFALRLKIAPTGSSRSLDIMPTLNSSFICKFPEENTITGNSMRRLRRSIVRN